MDIYSDDVFELHIEGMTPIVGENAEGHLKLCQWEFEGSLSLKIVDIPNWLVQGETDRIIITQPRTGEPQFPIRRMINDISNIENLLAGMGIRENN